MNNVSLSGRLTADPTITRTESTTVASFRIAVNRGYSREGQPDADFINVVAFGKSAEFVEKYFTKGKAILLTGRIQTGSYTNRDGVKVYTTDIVAERVEFGESKSAESGTPAAPAPSQLPPTAQVPQQQFSQAPPQQNTVVPNYNSQLPPQYQAPQPQYQQAPQGYAPQPQYQQYQQPQQFVINPAKINIPVGVDEDVPFT